MSLMKWLPALLILILLKSLIWTFVVPVFQTPDEQAHFAQLQWYAENKNLQIDGEKNLSLEIAVAEEILGTRRDGQGNNKFTYHPEYKNNSPVPDLPKEARTIYVDREAAIYPPLYYVLALPFYHLVYNHNLADRVMFARLTSAIWHLMLVICAFYIGKIIWQDKFKSLTLAVMAGFHPMVSYVAAGLHPDNLLNLIYSLGLLVGLLILKNGVKIKYLFFLALLFFAGFQTKILIVFLLPVIASVVLNNYLVLIIPVPAFIFQWPIPYMPANTAGGISFVDYVKFRLPKLFFEVWPWFWGVFKWLGVTLPPLVLKVITRVSIVSAFGLLIRLFKEKNFEHRAVIFFILSSVSFILYLCLWDWRLMQSLGYSQGLQGRYLFPNVVPIMALLLIGLAQLGKLIRQEKLILILTSLSFIFLNFFSLFYLYKIYY